MCRRILTIVNLHDHDGEWFYAIDVFAPDAFVLEHNLVERDYWGLLEDPREMVTTLTTTSFPNGARWVVARDLATALRNLADYAAEDPPCRSSLTEGVRELLP
jgi:hypothetical protein